MDEEEDCREDNIEWWIKSSSYCICKCGFQGVELRALKMHIRDTHLHCKEDSE